MGPAVKLPPSRISADELFDALESAPLADAGDFTPEELDRIEAAIAAPRGPGKSSAEILEMLAERARKEE